MGTLTHKTRVKEKSTSIFVDPVHKYVHSANLSNLQQKRDQQYEEKFLQIQINFSLVHPLHTTTAPADILVSQPVAVYTRLVRNS